MWKVLRSSPGSTGSANKCVFDTLPADASLCRGLSSLSASASLSFCLGTSLSRPWIAGILKNPEIFFSNIAYRETKINQKKKRKKTDVKIVKNGTKEEQVKRSQWH